MIKVLGFFVLVLLVSADFPEAVPVDDEICLSEEEEKLFNLIMGYRKTKKLKALPFSAKLTQVAQAHARDLAANFDYENKDNCNPHSWSDKGNWKPCCYTDDHALAECMQGKPKEITGYSGEGYEIAYYSRKGASAEEALKGWQKSTSHNPLLINSGTWSKLQWQGIGIGIYGEYGVVWFGEVKDKSAYKICP